MSSQCKKTTKAGVLKIAKIADRKLIFIPIMFILARIPGTVRFLLFLSNNTARKLGPGSKALLSLQVFIDIYGVTQKQLHELDRT